MLKYLPIPLLLFFLLFPGADAQAQVAIYSNSSLRAQFNEALHAVYGLEFDKARSQVKDIEARLGEHPAVYLIKAFVIYWESKPLKMGTPEFARFENYQKEALRLCGQILEKDPDNIEAAFFALTAHAYLAQLYADNYERLKALGEAKSFYNYMIEGFDLLDKYPEYYFPCGIYNYYREKYPEENPFYRPFLWFFRSGDKKEGLEMLKQGADKGMFTEVESITYLFHIYLRYEYRPDKALPYARKLHRLFPANPNFLANYVEVLLNRDSFGRDHHLIDSLKSSESSYYRYVGHIFSGMYHEKHAADYDAALRAYLLADELGNKETMRNPHYDSYLYCGLGRIYLRQGNRQKALQYFKLAQKYAEYAFMKKEAKSYLDKL